ncbi:MarR family transcriptional regulator [Candidatus Thorarchaeota archaeon]|nr:MAG: MarR family transcriptional regulator [Candidatus Thorarchaeota archaeon]
MKSLGPGELKVLRRLAIDPSLRKADLAQELGVTRSAVTQVWQKLEKERSLAIRGSLDYGRLGYLLIFGWACGVENSDVLDKFSGWLNSSSFVTRMTRSIMSSTMDVRVYFEAVVPVGSSEDWFSSQLTRFEKRPYSLNLKWGIASSVSHNMNLGIFNGQSWSFSNDFRFLASIDAAKGYVEVLPVVGMMDLGDVRGPDPADIVYGYSISENYYTTARDVEENLINAGLDPPTGRTIRRKLKRFRREVAQPYLDIDDIGLNRKLVVSLGDVGPKESQLSRLLKAQATVFPKARVISGSNLTVLDLEVPPQVDWLTMSQILSGVAGKTSEICTFIANDNEIEKRFESVISLSTLARRSS